MISVEVQQWQQSDCTPIQHKVKLLCWPMMHWGNRLVTITDSHGIEVYSAKLSDKVVSNKTIDLRDIAAGVYKCTLPTSAEK